MFSKVRQKISELRSLKADLTTSHGQQERETRQLASLLDDFKSSIDVSAELTADFHRWAKDKPIPREPLVSICVATYDRAELLTQRCLPSLLEQTYRKLEIIVVGDHAAESTVTAMENFRDSRLRFVNLEQRGIYPEHSELRWMVAGTVPMNTALGLSQGEYITHLDDDDEYDRHRIERLVDFAIEKQLDVVWHPFWIRYADGVEALAEAPEFSFGSVTTGSIFYRSWFKAIPWDPDAYLMREPGDWNRFRKFKYVRPRMGRCPEPLLWHYRGGTQ